MTTEAGDLIDKEVAVSEKTRIMLDDIVSQSTRLLEEFASKKTQSEQLQQRMQQIQMDVHGLSSTANYLLKREAFDNGSDNFTYNKDNKTITVKVRKNNGSNDESKGNDSANPSS